MNSSQTIYQPRTYVLSFALGCVAFSATPLLAVEKHSTSASGALSDASTLYQPAPIEAENEVCFCTATYSDGTSEEVSECSRNQCPDLETFNACQDVGVTGAMPIGGCRLLDTCECDCRSTEPVVSESYDEDLYLAGVPNFWQFDYRCGAFGDNAVGCGPVAASMVMYWWAQQGYDGLVTGLMSGTGSSPAVLQHDWKGMVEAFRDDYLDGGICVADQYATLQGTMGDGIAAFIADRGYSANVRHLKVCDGCNRNASDEISDEEGLDTIVNELQAGRPVIMGFNVGPAFSTSDTFDDFESAPVTTYTGELSNGAPLSGIINHYAVITGYQRIGGQDLLWLNLGWEGDFDIPVLWNVAGKWLHLYTVEVNGAANGDKFCAIDRGVAATFLDDEDLDVSCSSGISCSSGLAPETVLAGASCGIVRELHVSEYYPSWSGTSFECDPMAGHDLEPVDLNDRFDTGGTTRSV